MTAGYVGTRRRPSTVLRLLGSDRVEAVASAVFGATMASAVLLHFAAREHAAALTALIISGAALALVIASALAGYSYARSMRRLGGDR